MQSEDWTPEGEPKGERWGTRGEGGGQGERKGGDKRRRVIGSVVVCRGHTSGLQNRTWLFLMSSRRRNLRTCGHQGRGRGQWDSRGSGQPDGR